jgi:NAD-dependent SIR2 family protein deacetylase
MSERLFFTIDKFSHSAALELRYNYKHFRMALHRGDLAQLDRTLIEMGSVARRADLPTALINEYMAFIEHEIEMEVARGRIPPSLSNDLLRRFSYEFRRERPVITRRALGKRAKSLFEQELEEIKKIKIHPEDSVLFFLGAGASKPPPSNIPTVSELLSELWKKSNQMENKPLSKLEQWCKENQIDNIEEMLTGVTLSDFMIRNRKVHNLLNSVLYPQWASLKDLSIRDVETVSSFQSMIDTFFSLLVGTMLSAQPNPAHEAIVTFASSFPKTSIVTTNYDLCMDQALDKAAKAYTYIIGSQKRDAMPLIKMHGSINWFYCQTCQNVLMPTVENMRKAIESQMPYSVTGMCPECNSPTKQFIVPPTTYKFLIYPPIIEVWNAAREILQCSKFYVIVGYSFALGDDYILKMVLKAIREDPSKQVIFIDKSAETLEKFKHLVTIHTVGFDAKNVHCLQGSAEDLVQKVIDILTSKEKAKKKQVRKTS